MERYEFTPMLGPAEHFPVGSVEWSQRLCHAGISLLDVGRRASQGA